MKDHFSVQLSSIDSFHHCNFFFIEVSSLRLQSDGGGTHISEEASRTMIPMKLCVTSSAPFQIRHSELILFTTNISFSAS